MRGHTYRTRVPGASPIAPEPVVELSQILSLHIVLSCSRTTISLLAEPGLSDSSRLKPYPWCQVMCTRVRSCSCMPQCLLEEAGSRLLTTTTGVEHHVTRNLRTTMTQDHISSTGSLHVAPQLDVWLACHRPRFPLPASCHPHPRSRERSLVLDDVVEYVHSSVGSFPNGFLPRRPSTGVCTWRGQ